jgi:hypothetical protein
VKREAGFPAIVVPGYLHGPRRRMTRGRGSSVVAGVPGAAVPQDGGTSPEKQSGEEDKDEGEAAKVGDLLAAEGGEVKEEKDDDPDDEREMALMPAGMSPASIRKWRADSFARRLAPELAMNCQGTAATAKKMEKLWAACNVEKESENCAELDKTRTKRTMGQEISKGKIVLEKEDEVLFDRLGKLLALHPNLYYLPGVQAAFFRRKGTKVVEEVKSLDSGDHVKECDFDIFKPIDEKDELTVEEYSELPEGGQRKFVPKEALVRTMDQPRALQIVLSSNLLRPALEKLVNRSIPGEVALESFCASAESSGLDDTIPKLKPVVGLLAMFRKRPGPRNLQAANELMTARTVLSKQLADMPQWQLRWKHLKDQVG